MTKPTINDARWQEWADKFLSAELSDPGPDKTAMVMGFFHTRRSLSAEELAQLAEDFSENFAYKVCLSHAQRLDLSIDDEALQFMTLISDNLGEIVMNVHGARRLQQKLGVEHLTMQQLFENVYAGGLRSDDVLSTLWNEQKLTNEERMILGGMDNYIDHVQSGETVH